MVKITHVIVQELLDIRIDTGIATERGDVGLAKTPKIEGVSVEVALNVGAGERLLGFRCAGAPGTA